MLGKLYGITGNLNIALDEYKLAQKYGTENIFYYEDLGIFYYKAGFFDQSIKEYENLLVYVPNYSLAHRELGRIYAVNNYNLPKAVYHINRYLSTNPPEKEREWYQNKLQELMKIK